MLRRTLLQAAAASAACALSAPLTAQSFPSRPIRMVVPFPPGGPTDSFARFFADALGRQLGQQVVVENKAGASGAIGSLDVMRSAADGYTLLFGTASTHMLYNLVQTKPQYDAVSDFNFIGVLGGAPLVFVVSPQMPRSLKTVMIASKINPGKYSYGSPGAGTLMHVAAERLKQVANAPMTHVPYRGASPAMQDLIGGQIEMTVDTLGGALQHHQSGRVRIVGVATAKRVSTAPDIPTVAESADLDKPFEAMLWNLVAVPKDTPPAVQQALAEATRRAMDDATLREKLASQSMFADPHIGQAKALAYLKAEAVKWKPIVDALGSQIRN